MPGGSSSLTSLNWAPAAHRYFRPNQHHCFQVLPEPDMESQGFGFRTLRLLVVLGQKGLTRPLAGHLLFSTAAPPHASQGLRAHGWKTLCTVLRTLQTPGWRLGRGSLTAAGTWERGPHSRLGLTSAENSRMWGPRSLEHGRERSTCAAPGHIP